MKRSRRGTPAAPAGDQAVVTAEPETGLHESITRGVTADCPTCRRERPIEEFVEGTVELYYDSAPPSCLECREKGLVLKEPEVMSSLNVLHRRILKALLMGKNYSEAAKLAGCSYSYVRNLVKDHGEVNGDFRRAFQMMLEVEGLDFHSLVRMAKVLFYSREPKWNPSSEEWDYFPDNKTRLGVLRHLTKLRELDPPPLNNLPPAVPMIQIVTNVGADAKPKDAPGSFVIETGPVPEEIPAESGQGG